MNLLRETLDKLVLLLRFIKDMTYSILLTQCSKKSYRRSRKRLKLVLIE